MLYLHENSVLHRDLKTANIFLKQDYTIKIGDLGISRQMENTDKLASTKMIGTLPYMSPEIFNGVPYGQKNDIWALGCILYRLCSFKGPYDAENIGQLCNKVLNQTHTPLLDIYS